MTRAALMHRDRFRCAYCGSQGRHRRPRGAAQPRWRPLLGELRGGCSTCNHRKADRLLAELGWTLRRCRAAEGTALAVAVVGQGTRPGMGCDIWVRARPKCLVGYGLRREHSTYPFPPRRGSAGRHAGVDRADLGRQQEPQGPAPGDLPDVRQVDARTDPVGVRGAR
jgi:hypothetical protein